MIRFLLAALAFTLASPAVSQVYSPTSIDASQLAWRTELTAEITARQSLTTAAGCKFIYVAGNPTTIANTTTETSIVTTPLFGSTAIPACMTSNGLEIQAHVDGLYTAATLAPGTLLQSIKLNGTTVCSVTLGNLATSGAANLGAHGNAYIQISPSGVVRCTGFLGYQVTGTMEAPGYWQTVGTPTITPGTALTFDYTGKWSAAVNTITATALIVTVNRP